MSKADTAFQQANSLFVDEDYAGALKSYNEAVQADPNNVEYYLKRSACQSKLKNFTGAYFEFRLAKSIFSYLFSDAVADANTAIKLAPNNAHAFMKKG